MEPMSVSPIKRRSTLPQLTQSTSAPTFSNNFKAKLDDRSTRRNEQAQRHTSMVRLGALKHHAKVLRHRENKRAEHDDRKEKAHAKELERARRRKALEKAAMPRVPERPRARRVEAVEAPAKLSAAQAQALDLRMRREMAALRVGGPPGCCSVQCFLAELPSFSSMPRRQALGFRHPLCRCSLTLRP